MEVIIIVLFLIVAIILITMIKNNLSKLKDTMT